jgi:protoheme ferro-lyase
MNVSLTSYKKFLVAAATAFAAIAIPAQATDCTTNCQNVASQAGNAAAQQAQTAALNSCLANSWNAVQVNSCMMYKQPTIQAAYDQAYQQAYNQCASSCH